MDLLSKHNFNMNCEDLNTSNVSDYDNIDFSNILKEAFHATIDSNKDVIIKTPIFNLPDELENVENSISSLSSTSVLTNKLLSDICEVPRKIFCPFCVDFVLYEFVMKEHLHKKHRKELRKLSNDTTDIPVMNTCFHCSAVLCNKTILLDHTILYHPEVVCNVTKTDNFVCGFCQLSLPRENTILLNHIKTKHYKTAKNVILKNNIFDDGNDSQKLECLFKQLKTTSTPEAVAHPKGILKTTGNGVIVKNEAIHKSKSGIVSKKMNSRRQLRFNLPELENQNKSNGLSPRQKCNWKKHFKSKKKRSDTENINGMHFQCGHCKEMFSENADLICHLEMKHKKISNILSKPYQCAQCKVKFFKNRFLVLHNKFHHLNK